MGIITQKKVNSNFCSFISWPLQLTSICSIWVRKISLFPTENLKLPKFSAYLPPNPTMKSTIGILPLVIGTPIPTASKTNYQELMFCTKLILRFIIFRNVIAIPDERFKYYYYHHPVSSFSETRLAQTGWSNVVPWIGNRCA